MIEVFTPGVEGVGTTRDHVSFTLIRGRPTLAAKNKGGVVYGQKQTPKFLNKKNGERVFLALNRDRSMNYKLLFEPGIHEIPADKIEEIFAAPFYSAIRTRLARRLRAFITELEETELVFECWVGGSFLTTKPNPADADILIFFDLSTFKALQADKRLKAEKLLDNQYSEYSKLHIYLALHGNQEERCYWLGNFGFSREEEPRGIVRIAFDTMKGTEYESRLSLLQR